MQEALERLGGVQSLEDPPLLLERHGVDRDLHPLPDPVLRFGLLDVHVLDADRARVGVTEDPEDVAQRHDRAAEPTCPERPGRELTVEVPDGEAVVRDIELLVGDRLASAERIEVGDEVAADPVHVDEGLDLQHLLALGRGIRERAAVGTPARRLVRHGEAGEHVVEEAVLAEQELVDPAEELAALGAPDDAVVVGVGERRDLAHAQLGERLRVSALVLGRVSDGSHSEDEALAGHEAGDRVDRADHPRVRDRAGCAGEIVGGHVAVADLRDQRLVGTPEGCEVHRVGFRDAGDEQRVRAVPALDVDGKTQVDVLMADDDGLAVLRRKPGVQVGEVAERAHHRVRDQVGEAHLARAPLRSRWLLRIWRFTSSSLAGTVRTDVAVGTARLASMFSAVRAAAPRSGSVSSPSSTIGPGCVARVGGAAAD